MTILCSVCGCIWLDRLDMTPCEAFYAYITDVSNFCTLECMLYPTIPDTVRNQLDLKYHVCISRGKWAMV
jgi:hypothetical protein